MQRKPLALLLALAASAALAAAASGQSIGLGARVGVFGVGGEANADFGRRFGVRVGIGAVPVYVSGTDSDGEYNIKLPSILTNVGADVYPFGGRFRLSGGFLLKHDISMSARITGTVDLNDRTYTGAEAGTIFGNLAWSSVAPYATFGLSGRGRRFGLAFDIGAAFLGEPTLTLTSNGPAYRNNAQFRADLAAEQKKSQDDASKYLKVLPLLSFGIRWGM